MLRLGLQPGELEGAPGGARLARPLVLGTAGEFGQGSVEDDAAALLKVGLCSPGRLLALSILSNSPRTLVIVKTCSLIGLSATY